MVENGRFTTGAFLGSVRFGSSTLRFLDGSSSAARSACLDEVSGARLKGQSIHAPLP